MTNKNFLFSNQVSSFLSDFGYPLYLFMAFVFDLLKVEVSNTPLRGEHEPIWPGLPRMVVLM